MLPAVLGLGVLLVAVLLAVIKLRGKPAEQAQHVDFDQVRQAALGAQLSSKTGMLFMFTEE
jgi:hypothetical protein